MTVSVRVFFHFFFVNNFFFESSVHIHFYRTKPFLIAFVKTYIYIYKSFPVELGNKNSIVFSKRILANKLKLYIRLFMDDGLRITQISI